MINQVLSVLAAPVKMINQVLSPEPASPKPESSEQLYDQLVSPQIALVFFAAFGLIAADVMGPASLHILPQLDMLVHEAVASHTSLAFRTGIADILISDVFITSALFGWFGCTAVALLRKPLTTLPALLLSWFFYFTTCGAVLVDPPVVDMLKKTFARVRPSELHHDTFSFPSGHTTAAVFMTGVLLIVLLPRAAQASNTSSTTVTNRKLLLPASGVLRVWGAAWATTACGRVLADAHWLSDTLAGGCLGIACVSVVACAVNYVEMAWPPSTSQQKADVK
eukprot:jgi/Chrzof1/394/Cz01g14080.t1